MRESEVDFSTYTQFYKSQWDELMAQQSDSGEPLMDSPGRCIWTTWNVSYQAIKVRNLSAANLLLLWAWLDNRDLWHELLIAASAMEGTPLPKWLLDIAAHRLRYTEAVRLLLNYGLLERVEGADAYAIHPVIHRWTLSAQQGEQRIEMGRLAVLVVGCCNAGSETASWIFERRLLNHALHCSELIVTDTANIIVWEYRDQVLLLAASNIGALLQEHGRANAAERICKCALSEYEKNPDRDNIMMTLNLLNIIGAVYYRQGKLDMAEKTWERVLQGQMKKVGIRHLGTLQTINNLGIVYMEQGKLDDAEGKYLLALQEQKKLFDKDDPSVLDVIHNIGALYQIRGKLAEAAQMFKQAFEGKKKTLGLEHHSTLRAAGLLSVLYQRLGKLDAAKEIFLQELQAYETRDGPEGTETLRTLYNLGCVYMDLNDVSQAQIMYQRALKGLEKGPLASHTLALDTLNKLGIIYMKQGRLNLAEETLMRALREKEKVLGPTHKSTFETVHNLDKVRRLQGRTRETRTFPQPEQMWIQKLRLQEEVDEEVDEIIGQSMATENLRNATLEATKRTSPSI
ncbi:hypothetical protein EIK77_002011 [Talaromyces pinophilus]|nr:hypothetical protein EIK77_002011 [Talaromyces pinophilus]